MATVWTSNAAVTHPEKPGSVTDATYRSTPRRTAARSTAYAHPKKPGSAPAVQFSPSQKTVTGLKSTWGKGRKKQPDPGRGELGSQFPAKAREQTTDDLLWRSNEKKNSRLPSQEQTGAPQKAGERLGDDLFGATKKKWRPVTPQKRS
jgi:hypothetical protein